MQWHALYQKLWDLRTEGPEAPLSYEALRQKMPIPERLTPAHVWQVMHKRWDPKDNEVRAAFGLDPLGLAPVCHCGEVHSTKRCTKKEKSRRYKDLLAWPDEELKSALQDALQRLREPQEP